MTRNFCDPGVAFMSKVKVKMALKGNISYMVCCRWFIVCTLIANGV